MSKRRRMFDINLPADDAPAELETKSDGPRRGPMASAVRESAEALRARTDTEAAVRAENDRLAHEHVRLKRLGLITDLVPIDLIDSDKLRRDRAQGEDEDLADLIASIREIGLSNPIRVEAAAERFELIQGYRRLAAYRSLYAETGDEAWATIPAGMVAPGDDIVTSYRRMVDENLVRKDISFAEMAMLAQEFAADPQTPAQDLGKAVADLYASAGYQKRSYIRAFAELLEMLDGALQHAEALPRNVGLELRRCFVEGGSLPVELQADLRAHPTRSADDEVAIVRAFVSSAKGQGRAQDLPHGEDSMDIEAMAPAAKSKAKTTFRLTSADGEIKCTAASGRLEIRSASDFTRYDRRRLEAAVRAFMSTLTSD